MKKETSIKLKSTYDLFVKEQPALVKVTDANRPSALEAALSAAKVKHVIDRAKSENKFQRMVRESKIFEKK